MRHTIPWVAPMTTLRDIALFLLEKNQEAELELTRYKEAFQKDPNRESLLSSADASQSVQAVLARHALIDQHVRNLLEGKDEPDLLQTILELLRPKPIANKPNSPKG